MAKLEADTSELQHEREQQQLAIAELEQLVAKFKQQVEQQQAEIHSKESQKKQADDEVTQLQEQKEEHLQQIAVLRVEVKGLKQTVEQMSSSKQKDNDVWEAEIQRLQSQIHALQSSLEAVRDNLQLSAEQQQTICLLDQDNDNLHADVDIFQFDINQTLLQQIQNIKTYMTDLNDYLNQ